MKTSFTKLFASIAVAAALVSSFANFANAQGLIGRIIHEAINEVEDHYDYDYDFNGQSGHNGHSFNGNGGHGHSGNRGRQNWDNGNGQQFQPVQQQSMPNWLLGTWTVNDGRMGGKTEVVIANGTFTTVGYSLSQGGYRELSRTTQSARYSQNGLVIGNATFQVAATPGSLTLTGNGSTVKLVKPTQNGGSGSVISGGPINNGGQTQIVHVSGITANRLPVAMQGTWYEVSLNSKGEQILNRYDLGNDGSYEMFQYAISAQGEADLSSPIARLSTLATAAQRSLSFKNGTLSLGAAGTKFAEGPYTATVSGSTLTLVDSTETRTLTRQP